MVNGVVEGVSTKFGKYSILVNGTWYGTKEEWATVKPNKGDEVEFDDGGNKYMKKVKIVSESDGAAPASAGASPARTYGGKGVFPIPPLDGQRAILRQNALTNARELVTAIGVIKPQSAKDMENVIDDILTIAAKFESYTSGDADVERVKAKMEEAFKEDAA